MELEKLFSNIFDKLHRFGFRSEVSLVNLLAFLVRERILAQNLKNSLATQVLEEFQHHTNSQLLHEIGEVLTSVDFSSISSEEFRTGCNFLINEFSLNKINEFSLNRRNGEFFIPPSATNLVIDFVNPKPNQVVFDLTCGIGSFFVELNKRFPTYNLRFIGQEINSQIRFLCLLNMVANEVFNAEIYLDNSLETIRFEGQAKIDIALANLPFGMRFFGGNHTPETAFPETAFIELMLSSTKNDGQVVVVVPESFLSHSSIMSFRKTLLENDLIEVIFSLPQNAFRRNTIIKTSIIIFNKNKSDKDFIIFDGKESKFEKTQVNINEILLTQNYNLQASRYALKEAKELKSILSTSPFEIVKLKDLIYSSISGANYLSANQIIENSSEELPFVRVVDLAKNEDEFDFDISKVERKISREKAHKVIDFSAVLVSKLAPKLKPTYFNFTGLPIVIGSDIIALKMKEDINVKYFLTQLHSRLVQIQVEMISSGTTFNRISTQDFLDIEIILPPLAEQKLQIFERSGVIEEKAIAEEKLIDAQFDVVASINHSLKNKLAVIINDYDTLVRFLRRKERKSETIIFSDAISANAVGDDIDTIEIITNRLKTNLSDASKVFNNALKIQRQNLKKDVVELVKFFKEEVKPLYIGKNFSIEIIAKPNLKLNVWLDKDAFKDVIENLIENAKSHGFVDDEKNYRIVFDLSKLKDEDGFDEHTSTKYARIMYKNDGKPFPKNFSFEDYKQFSNKSGKTQGTGIGGYVINKIIELHDGRFNFISPSDDFTVEFEILLPLEN